MLFFIGNKELEYTIREIRRKIRASMDGVISDSMTHHGIVYKKNYGVSIPRLKEISKSYQPGHNLAQQLWALKIRETMILATLLQPTDTFTPTHAELWLRDVKQPELAEQLCMNLFSKLTYADQLVLEWTRSPDLWSRIVGFMLAARIWNTLTATQAEETIDIALHHSGTNELLLYKSIALALCRLCRRGKETREVIGQKINHFGFSEKTSEKYIFNEVKNEISFLDF